MSISLSRSWKTYKDRRGSGAKGIHRYQALKLDIRGIECGEILRCAQNDMIKEIVGFRWAQPKPGNLT